MQSAASAAAAVNADQAVLVAVYSSPATVRWPRRADYLQVFLLV